MTNRGYTTTPERDYPVFGRAALSSFQASPIPDVATAQTVATMWTNVRASIDHPRIQAAVRQAIAGRTSDRQRAAGIFEWVKSHVEFVRDEKLEILTAPYKLLDMPQPAGDCDCFTMLMCAMLFTARIDCEIVTIAANRKDPLMFSHVYPIARLSDGTKLTLDAAAFDLPGEEASTYTRRVVWQMFGVPTRRHTLHGIDDQVLAGHSRASVSEPTMQRYHRGVGSIDDQVLNGRRRPQLGRYRWPALGRYRSLGDDGVDLTFFGDTPIDPAVTITGTPNIGGGGGGGGSASSGFDWASTFGRLLPGIFGTAERIATLKATPGGSYMRGPNGSLYYQGGGAPPPAGILGGFGSGGSSLLWIIGGGLVLFTAASMGGRK